MVKTPTYEISPDSPRSRTPQRLRKVQPGFTLIELLVVLAIGAMLVSLVPSAFDKLRDTSQYRDTLRALVLDLRQARQQALAYGQVVRFSVDLSKHQFGIEGQRLKSVPASLEIKATVGAIEVSGGNPKAFFVFLPDGGSSGGTIELIRHAGGGVRVRVDWLSGQITQEPRIP
jgi:general secretion pathway protein H